MPISAICCNVLLSVGEVFIARFESEVAGGHTAAKGAGSSDESTRGGVCMYMYIYTCM